MTNEPNCTRHGIQFQKRFRSNWNTSQGIKKKGSKSGEEEEEGDLSSSEVLKSTILLLPDPDLFTKLSKLIFSELETKLFPKLHHDLEFYPEERLTKIK